MLFSRHIVIIVTLIACLSAMWFSQQAALADYSFASFRTISSAWKSGVPKSEWQEAFGEINVSASQLPNSAQYRQEKGGLLRLCATYWVDCDVSKAEANTLALAELTEATKLRDNYGLGLATLALSERDARFAPDRYSDTAYAALNAAPNDPQVIVLVIELVLSRWDELGGAANRFKPIIASAIQSSRKLLNQRTYELLGNFPNSIQDPVFFVWLAENLVNTETSIRDARIILTHWARWPTASRPALLGKLGGLLSDRRSSRLLMKIASEEKKLPLMCMFFGRESGGAAACKDQRLQKLLTN